MRTGKGIHVFVDMDETLLKGRYLHNFTPSDFTFREDGYNVSSVSERGMSSRTWRKAFNEDADREVATHPRSDYRGGDGGYRRWLENIVMERKAAQHGWHTLWFQHDEAIAIYPRPGAVEFLKAASELGTLCLCSTAVDDYARAALSHMGVLGMFKEVCTRKDIYPSSTKWCGGGRQGVRGWEWEGDPAFVLVDDLFMETEAILEKMHFLGVPPNGSFNRHFVRVFSYDGWDSDDHLMSYALPALKEAVGRLVSVEGK